MNENFKNHIAAQAFKQELEKIAISEKEMDFVANRVGQRAIRREDVGIRKSIKKMLGVQADIMPAGPSYSGKNDRVFQPKGGLTRTMDTLNKNTKQKITPDFTGSKKNIARNQKGFNQMGMIHEGMERANVKRNPFVALTHGSPKVLLQEHNMLTTSPKKYKQAKDKLIGVRNLAEAGVVERALANVEPGYQHGKSKRLSRHKIKKYDKVIRSHFVNEVVPLAGMDAKGYIKKLKSTGKNILSPKQIKRNVKNVRSVAGLPAPKPPMAKRIAPVVRGAKKIFKGNKRFASKALKFLLRKGR